MEQRRERERATDRQMETTDPSHKQAFAFIKLVPKPIPGEDQGNMKSTYQLSRPCLSLYAPFYERSAKDPV